MFLSTRGYHYYYNFIVKASKQNCENLLNKKLNLLIFEIKKIPSIKFLFFLTYIVFSGKIFMGDRIKIKFENILIGKLAVSRTYNDFACYTNKFRFYLKFIKSLYRAGCIIKTCNYYQNNFDIKGIYVDHCVHLNGIIFSFFSLKGLPIYTNNYPLGIFFIDFRNNKNKHQLKYEDALKISIKKKINNSQKKEAKKKISDLTKKKKFIPYLIKVNYKKIDNLDYKSFDYVIYAHSFTDAQLLFGYSGFENTLEWFEFTLDNLLVKNQKVLVKPHPNFYNHSFAENSRWDKKIYEIIRKKYKEHNNIFFLDKPIHNYLLLKKLNKNCILVSKYGTVILESAYMNFRSICSTQNIFNKKFDIANTWSNKSEYIKLLNCNYSKLKKPNSDDLLKLIYSIFFVHSSDYHVNHFINIIRRNLRLTKKKYEKKFANKGAAKITNYHNNELKKYTKLIADKIINQISDTIHQVRF